MLAIALFMSFSLPGHASSSRSAESIEGTGIALSTTLFNELYGKPTSTDNAVSVLNKNASIRLYDLQIQSDNIQFTADIQYGNKNKTLVAAGKLYKSYKQKSSINSVVGDISDKSGQFEVLLFEIFNDKTEGKTIVDQRLRNTPHLKLYLKDKTNQLLLFELPLPSSLMNVVVSNNDEIDTTKDFFWFARVITPYELKTISADESMKRMLGVSNSGVFVPQGVGYFSDWAHNSVYYAAFYIGYDLVEAYSLPCGTWKALDVHGQSTWVLSFKVAEHVSVNGKTDRRLTNPFSYRNVKLAIGVGEKSSIVHAMVDGRLSGGSSGSSLVMRIFEMAFANLAPTISQIKNWINAVIDLGSDKTIVLGSSNIKLNTDPSSVEGANSKNHEMYRYTDIDGPNTGHYMVLQATVQYEGQSRTSATANGVMKVKWDTDYAGYYYDTDSKEITFTYNVEP